MTMRRAIGLMSGTSLDGRRRRAHRDRRRDHPGRAQPQRLPRAAGADGLPRLFRRRPGAPAPGADRRGGRDRAQRATGLPRPGRGAGDAAPRRGGRELPRRERPLPADIDVVGFHGQTVVHRPDQKMSVQIGDGGALSRRLGIKVVSDLRHADIEAGGQGAPLVPVFHRALAQASGFTESLGILNIGGVANATLIARDGRILLAFDTGPGNALIDDWMRERTGHALDDNGRTAARGRPDEPLLAWLLIHPFFSRRPPKSLDRNWFSHKLAASSRPRTAPRRSPPSRRGPSPGPSTTLPTRRSAGSSPAAGPATASCCASSTTSCAPRSRPPTPSAGPRPSWRPRPSPTWRSARSRAADHLPVDDGGERGDQRRGAGAAGGVGRPVRHRRTLREARSHR